MEFPPRNPPILIPICFLVGFHYFGGCFLTVIEKLFKFIRRYVPIVIRIKIHKGILYFRILEHFLLITSSH